MTGKRYYLTTLGDWQRHAARFANSHYIVLDAPASLTALEAPASPITFDPTGPGAVPVGAARVDAARPAATQILALVEGDEGVHFALEDDATFEALPHALASKPISPRAQAALAPFGVAPGAGTFDAAEILARIHPLLRHRVF